MAQETKQYSHITPWGGIGRRTCRLAHWAPLKKSTFFLRLIFFPLGNFFVVTGVWHWAEKNIALRATGGTPRASCHRYDKGGMSPVALSAIFFLFPPGISGTLRRFRGQKTPKMGGCCPPYKRGSSACTRAGQCPCGHYFPTEPCMYPI